MESRHCRRNADRSALVGPLAWTPQRGRRRIGRAEVTVGQARRSESVSESESSGLSWSNWAGSVRCTPRELARPATEEALVSLVRAADTQSCHVRVAGSGHSFTPLVETDGILVSLDDYAGIESYDRDVLQATVRAGTKLHDLGEPLLALGMAMENLGDRRRVATTSSTPLSLPSSRPWGRSSLRRVIALTFRTSSSSSTAPSQTPGRCRAGRSRSTADCSSSSIARDSWQPYSDTRSFTRRPATARRARNAAFCCRAQTWRPLSAPKTAATPTSP